MTSDDHEGIEKAANLGLTPGLARFVAEIGAAWELHPDLTSVSPTEARRIAEEVRRPWTRGGPVMAAVDELAVPSPHGSVPDVVKVRRYHPRRETTGALIYLHGGGWTLFSLETHDRLMREYAGRAGVIVLGVDYSLAPEAKYPVALDQVVAVARAAADPGAGLLEAGTPLAIGGDSAGANLALAAAIELREEGHPELLRAMLLNYGVFTRYSSAEAVERFGGPGNMLTHEEMEGFWANYLRDEKDAEDPLASPLSADLASLPPTLLVVASNDLLAEQSLALAHRLREANVSVELDVYEGACHSFLEAVSISSLADQALANSAAWLRKAVTPAR
ncbi:MAG TPA: alpha/beta hydrolase fold domain-containing protein [Thermoanaerobaculia bacterium]|nr:alpha/beta hydrolase fold domain-containing protein [Thermoanaerobaculia bacterium]